MTLVAQKKRQPSVHQQKRYGQHQSHNKHYLKTYWPYLPLFTLAAIIVIFGGIKLFGATGAVVGTVGVALAGVTILI